MPTWNPENKKIASALRMVKTPEEIERQRREEIETIIEAKVAQALRLLRPSTSQPPADPRPPG